MPERSFARPALASLLVLLTLTQSPSSAQAPVAGRPHLVTGAGEFGGPHVQAFDVTTGTVLSGLVGSFYAYNPAFIGGVRVAACDVTGDAVPDIITAAGPFGGPHVQVLDGVTANPVNGPLGSFYAFDPAFSGGVFVACGDVTGDGVPEVIAGADSGGSPHVRVFDLVTGGEAPGPIGSFLAYEADFTGGVRVASCDLSGDGRADIVTGRGPGSTGPLVRVFDAVTGATLPGPLGSFFPYNPAFIGGVYVACADVTGDAVPDIVTGAGPLGGPHVRVFDGVTGVEAPGPLGSFYAFNPAFGGGVRVAACDLTGDGFAELVVAAGPDGGAHVRILDGTTGAELTGPLGSFNAYDPNFTGGVFVACPVEIDAAPRVESTTPANGATNVPVDSDLVVTFSEPVIVSPTAFALACPAGTSIALTNTTASPATQFTLSPTPALPTSTLCNLIVVATEVTDQDGRDPPDRMRADATMSFTTAVCPVITVTSSVTPVPGGVVGTAYGPITMSQTGGSGPITWGMTGTPPPGLTLSAGGVLAGTPTQSGTYSFTVTATSPPGCSGSLDVTITIAPSPNQPPSFIAGANQTVLEDSAAQTVANWATAITPGPPGEAGQAVSFTVTGNTNAALFSVAPVVSPTGTLTYTPAADANGSATITLVLSDNGGTANGGDDTSDPQSFTITVTEVNDAPGFAQGADQIVGDNAGPQTVVGWATNISAGPANESTQTLTFVVIGNTNTTLFSAGPVVSAAGDLTFTPVLDTAGTATITLVLQDNGGTASGGVDTSIVHTFTITVTLVNDPPTAVPDTGTTGEDTVLTVAAPGVLGNDTDPDLVDTRTVSAVNGVPANVGTALTLASGAVVTVNADGSYVYNPTGVATFQALGQGQTATDTFTYTMQDSAGLPSSATVTITINGVNDLPALDLDADDDGGTPPTTGNDFAITFTEGDPPALIEDEVDATISDVDSPNLTSITVTITNVLDNLQEKLDVDLVTGGFNANFTKTLDDTTTPGVAVLTITATTPQPLADFNTLLRRVTYQNLDIDPDATTPRTVTFVVHDGIGASTTATTTVTVVAVDQPPAADDDSYTVAEGGTLTIAAPGVLDGDVDPEGDAPITAVLVTGPANASAFTLNSDGSFTYTHNGSETTTDSFTYRAVANSLPSAPATVTITITAVNDAPAITAGGTLNFIEGNPATAIDGTILVTDADSTTLASATVVIAVNYVNGQDFLALPVTAGITSIFTPATGTLTLTGSATVAAYQNALRTVTYFNGSDAPSPAPRTVAWIVNDGASPSNTATSTITVTPVNDPPVAFPDSGTTGENTVLNVAAPGVLGNDTDPDLDTRIVSAVNGVPANVGTPLTLASGAVVTVNADGSYVYDPTGVAAFQALGQGQTATDAFGYTMQDAGGLPSSATVTITITGVNDLPALDLDADDDGGTPPTTGNDFAITFTEADSPTFIEDEVDATISDVDSPNLTSITVTITNVLDALQEKLDVDLVTGGFAATFTKTFDDTTTPSVAVLTITATTPQPLADFNTLLRRVTYENLDIDPDATAPRTVTFVVHDGIGTSATATTTVTVVAVDQPPTADNDSYTVAEGGTLNIAAPGVLDGDTDPEGHTPITAVVVTGPANATTFTLNSDGSFTYTHNGSETTTDLFTYRAVANGLQSAPATVTITINAVNDAPVIAAGGTLNFVEGNPATAIDGAILVTDADNTTLASATVQIAVNYVNGQDVLALPVTAGITGIFTPATGTLTLTGSATVAAYQSALRTVTYFNGSNTPSPLPRTVAWIVNDGASSSNTATSTITVTPVNDPPVAVPDTGTTDENTVLNVAAPGVLGNDTDPDLDTRIVSAVNGVPANVGTPLTLASGAVVTVNADGSYGYDPTGVAAFQALGQGQTATDTFDYTMRDSGGLPSSATVTITINGANDLPALDLDADDDGGTPPTTGTDFAITFTEGDPPALIEDEVDATISDVDSPNLTSITVTITNVLDALQEKLDVDLVTGGFAANFTKTFDDTTTPGIAVLMITATTPQPLAAFNTLLRRVTYQNLDIDPDATTPRTITFVVHDGIGASATATTTVTVVAVDQPPAADDDSYSVNEGGTLTVPAPGVLDGDVDPEGDTPITAVLVTAPANATAFTLNSDGSVTYTHNGSETTTDAFTYRAVANGLPSAPATVTITITAVNDAPVITAAGTLNFVEGNPATAIDGTILVTDADSTNLASATVVIAVNYVNGQDFLALPVTAGITSIFTPATGTLTLTGSAAVAAYQAALRTVTYFNNSGTPSVAPRTVTWIVNDGSLSSNIAASTITVTAVNAAPIGGADSWTTFGNTTLAVDQAGPSTPFVADTTTSTFGVLDNDTDPEGDARVVTGIVGCADTTAPFVCTTTAGGSVTLESNGRFTYRPQAGDTGADTFQYVLTDVPSAGVAANVNVTVNLTLQERIWYVDGDVAGPGTGTSNDPFRVLPATAGDADDYVFVHQSTVTGFITLQTGQKLYGEAFGLSINQSLNGNPAPVVLVAPGTSPAIQATSGNTVRVLANTANGSITNVEIRGLTLSTTAASSNAIDVTSANAANVAVTISGVVVTAATAEGIDINQGSTGTATVSMTNVTVTSTGTGIDLNESAGTLTVTSFSGITITGDTGGSGIVVTNATFDATAGGAYDQVAGGATAVGTLANPVGGAGVVLTNVSGDLAFTDLDIFTTNGAGLQVSGTGAVNGAAGTGTLVSVAAGVATLQSTGGPVVSITSATAGLPLDSASVTSSPTTGISLVTVASGTTAASVSATSGSIANTTGISVNVSGGDVSLNYGGAITQTSNVAMVSVSGGHTAGTITFSGALNATNGTGLQFDNADSVTSYNFSGTTTLNGGDAGIDILNGSAGTFTFGTGTTMTNPSGTAFLLSGSNANVTYSGSISDNSGFAVDIDNHDAGTVTFQTGSIASTGTGIRVSNSNAGTINFNSPTIALTTAAAKAVTLDTSNAGGTINFAPAGGNGLDISTTTGIGFSALGGGTISVSGAGNTISASGAMAIEVTSTTIGAGGLNFASTTSGGGVRNVKLTSVTGGAIALGGGTLTGATGAAFLVGNGTGGANTGGTAAISYGGTMTSTGTVRAVDIQDRAAGAGDITLSGTITHSSGNANVIFLDDNIAGTIAFSGANSVLNGGTSAAVSLTDNTGTTISFIGGGLDIDTTTGTGFLATGGGTVTVQGAGNTIFANGSGSALQVANTQIGSANLNFQSVSAGTAAGSAGNGITLDNTGTAAGNGGLIVTGAGVAASGGTIQHKTGANGSTTAGIGIYLNQTRNASFSWMQLNHFDNFAIRGNALDGLTVANVVVSGTSGNNAANDEGALLLVNSGGTIAITNSNVSGGFEDNLRVDYNAVAGPAATFNVSGSTFRDLQAAGQIAQVNLRSQTAAASGWVVAFNFTSNTFENDANTLPPGGTENFSDGILATFEGPFAHDLTVEGSTFHHLSQGMDVTSNFSADVDYVIRNNNITFTEAVAAISFINGSSSTAQSFLTALIQGNTIGTSGVAQSGSRLGQGIVVDARGEEIAQFTIHANTIRRIEVGGIDVNANTGDGDLNIQITNNVIEQVENNAGVAISDGMRVLTGTGSLHDICLDARSNDSFKIGTSGSGDELQIRQVTNNVVFAIEGLTGSGTSAANVESYLDSQNPLFTPADGGSRVVTAASVVNFTSVGSCTTPAPQ